MKKGILILMGSIVGIIAIFALLFMSQYNGLVTTSENVSLGLSQIDNQLQRRADLIPNLVETVKGYAAQEKEIFESVSEARSKLMGAGTVGEKAEADAEMSGALSRLLAISESYPDLKSDANFRQLADELAGTENRIAVARMEYNEIARNYNTNIRRFPTNIIASMFGFEKAAYFEAAEGSQNVPVINFGN